MKKMTFLELAEKILKEKNEPMTPEEIWKFAQEKGYDKLIATKGKTPWRTIGAQIYVDIRDNKESPFKKIDSKPRKFFLKELANGGEFIDIEDNEGIMEEALTEIKYSERDLHPFLTYFAYTYLRAYTKTIAHQKSRKKSYAQWLHPDMVGVYFPFDDWKEEVVKFAKAIGNNIIKLYSFEIKKELTFSNIRESFFQAVSNSSWANEGYLVAAKISQDEEFLSELKRLSSAFGIGIIKIDIEDPDSSDILFPAKFKSELDWDTINKLSVENPDFNYFLERVQKDTSNIEVIKEKFDKVYDADKLKEKIKK